MPFSKMAGSSKITDLRNLLAARFPQTLPLSVTLLRTGLAALDEATGGGLRKGAITELIAPHFSAGSALLIHHLLKTAARDHYFLALIDGRDSFDPAPHDSTHLRHLLWVRCGKACEAVKAADLLLRDGNFPLVILDLVLNSAEELRKIPQANWYRLQRLVESLSTAFLVLTRHNLISSAQLKLGLDNRWQLRDLEKDNNLARLEFRAQRIHGQCHKAGAV